MRPNGWHKLRSRRMIDTRRPRSALLTPAHPATALQKGEFHDRSARPDAPGTEEIEAKRQKIVKARQEQRAHDPELKRHVSSLQERILRLRAATGGSQYDYETLRKEYDAKANAEVRELQKAARQERIQKLIAQADLNPDWMFDKMDSGDPALQYPIETARYFISGFEHWEKSGGAAC